MTEFELSAEDVRNLVITPPVAEQLAPGRRGHGFASLTCALLILVLAIGAGYRYGISVPSAQPAPPAPIRQARAPSAPQPKAAPPAPATEPVRFRNPFDKHEVFESPPGTTQQQARDAVADVLVQRAMERQAEYDAQRAKRRRPTSHG
jgi:hypothetical protein